MNKTESVELDNIEKKLIKQIKFYSRRNNSYKVRETEKKLAEYRKNKQISNGWKKTYNIVIDKKDEIEDFINKWIHTSWLDEYNEKCAYMQELFKKICKQEKEKLCSLRNQILKNETEIKHLQRFITSDAIFISHLYTFYSSYTVSEYYTQSPPSYEVVSNFLIVSKLISILTDNETDINSFLETLKKIDELRKYNDELNKQVEEVKRDIDVLNSEIGRFHCYIYDGPFTNMVSNSMFRLCIKLQSFLKISSDFFPKGDIFNTIVVSECLDASHCYEDPFDMCEKVDTNKYGLSRYGKFPTYEILPYFYLCGSSVYFPEYSDSVLTGRIYINILNFIHEKTFLKKLF